ncbi:MAG TPA: hypothetical protein ENJ06_02825 [Phycisphaeraceae bacterium]|nr:hypothetical protein [Phycisphaeraceae bacterium]
MSDLTIFAIPKPFAGHTGVIQRNALRSWVAQGVPVILVGDEDGMAEMAAEINALHIPDVDKNDLGTPLLDSAFRLAAQKVRTRCLAYFNSDIILTSDPGEILNKTDFPDFLAVGRRTNLDITEEIDFRDPGWARNINKLAERQGELFTEFGIDYFLMPRDSDLTRLPPFAVGRPRWDNWMCARTWRLGVPLVDLTAYFSVIHQNHDHKHIVGRGDHPYTGPEADANADLAGDDFMSIADATYFLDQRGNLRVNCLNLSRMYYQAARRSTGRTATAMNYFRSAACLARTGRPLQYLRNLRKRRSA